MTVLTTPHISVWKEEFPRGEGGKPVKKVVAVAVSLVVVLSGAYAVADALDAMPGPLTMRPVIPDPQPYPDPAPTATTPGFPTASPLPSGDLQPLVDGLAASPELGTAVSALVIDVATGDVVGALRPGALQAPASSLKLLTAAAALSELGPDRTLTTVATWDGTGLTLVGGGDLLLGVGEPQPGAVGHASLTDLAAQVAAALRAEGVDSAPLAVDESLFSGPRASPDWLPTVGFYMMPMSPLAIGAGMSDGERYDADPALAAGEAFARELGAAGIAVTGTVVTGTSPQGATTVGAIESAPISDVVAATLKPSENSLAEALGRLVALSRGLPGSAEGATQAILAELAELGLDTEGMVVRDASGLSPNTRVSTELLTSIIALSMDPEHPRLEGLVRSLPVAYLDGTLEDRAAGAAGMVRAKTGTLARVVSLSGVAQTDTGAVLIFSVLASELPEGGVPAARARLDRFVSDIVTGVTP